MLNRDSVLFGDEAIYLRFIISLPAKGTGGGVFDAEQAWIMLSQELVTIVGATFFYRNYDDSTRMLLQQFVDVQKIRTEIIQFMEQHDLWSPLLPMMRFFHAVAALMTGLRSARMLKPFNPPRPYR